MSDKRVIRLMGIPARNNAATLCTSMPDEWTVTFAPPRRSNLQNDRMWAMLTELSKQVDWHGQKLDPAEWKDVMTAALKRQKVVPGIDGGFVVLGSSTSRMGKAELSELIELIFAFGTQRGVEFHEPAEASA
jgi:hypothetical protein